MDPSVGCTRDRRLLRVETVVSGQYRWLVEGISTEHWTTMETRGDPLRYERYKQVLIYPKSNAAYTLRFWFVADLARFTENGDRASLDDEMVLLHATANAKGHYRQPDAPTYQGLLDALLASLRGKSFGSNGVVRRDPQRDLERRPLVVGRDV